MEKSDYQVELFRFSKGLFMWSIVFLIIGCMLIYANYESLDNLKLGLILALDIILALSIIFSGRYYFLHRKEFKVEKESADDKK